MLEDIFNESPKQTMKVEIHCHTNKYSPGSYIPPNELIAMAEASGYDALFLTDRGKVWPRYELASLSELCENLRLFSGIEVTLPYGRQVLVLGADDPIYEEFTTPREVLAQAAKDGYLTVLAHPFRWHDDLPEFIRLVDAMETATCTHSKPTLQEEAQRYASEYLLAPVYASDADGLNFMNKFWIETDAPFETPQEFRNLIVADRYTNRAREIETPLPPSYKTPTMAELSDEDLAALQAQPSLQD